MDMNTNSEPYVEAADTAPTAPPKWTDDKLDALDGDQIVHMYNGRAITLEQLERYQERRRRRELADQLRQLPGDVTECGPIQVNMLGAAGWITEEQRLRQFARFKRREMEMRAGSRFYLSPLARTAPPKRTRDESIMMADHMELMTAKSHACRVAVAGGTLGPDDWTVEEIDAEFASRRINRQ